MTRRRVLDDAAGEAREHQILGMQAQAAALARAALAAHRDPHTPQIDHHARPFSADDLDRHHHAVANEARHHLARRLAIEHLRRRRLLDPAVVHHRHAARERHRLGLVVRHVDEGRADLAMEAGKLLLHGLAQVHVQIGERLVEQHDRRPHREAAGERDALALAAGELMRPSLGHRFETDHRERALATRRLRSSDGTRRTRSANATFSATLICGHSA